MNNLLRVLPLKWVKLICSPAAEATIIQGLPCVIVPAGNKGAACPERAEHFTEGSGDIS